MTGNSTIKTITIVIALIAFGAGIGIFSARSQHPAVAPTIQGLLWPNPKVLYDFSTIDQNEQEFGLENLHDKWSFLFFGYTNCPDICPITLSVFKDVYRSLQNSSTAEEVQMIFVSVDPERDSPQQLKDYVSYFNNDFIGLGGSLENISTLTRQMGIAYFHDEPSAEGDYLVDHSASVFLIDPQGRVIAILSAPHNPEEIIRRFSEIRTYISNQAG